MSFNFSRIEDLMVLEELDPAIFLDPLLDFRFNDQMDTTLEMMRLQEFKKEFQLQSNQEFQQQFRERIKSFYHDHAKELELMMKDLELQFGPPKVQEKRMMEEMKRHEHEIHRQQEILKHFHKEDMLKRQEQNRMMMQQELNRLEESVQQLDVKMKRMKENIAAFENELKEHLINDGYLKRDERINSMNWDKNGDFTVNGRKVKKAHTETYNALRRKYFKDEFHFNHFE
jgi:hypothetical protein